MTTYLGLCLVVVGRDDHTVGSFSNVLESGVARPHNKRLSPHQVLLNLRKQIKTSGKQYCHTVGAQFSLQSCHTVGAQFSLQSCHTVGAQFSLTYTCGEVNPNTQLGQNFILSWRKGVPHLRGGGDNLIQATNRLWLSGSRFWSYHSRSK
jgi:hypothetical protein